MSERQVVWYLTAVNRAERKRRQGLWGMVLWFTGLLGAWCR